MGCCYVYIPPNITVQSAKKPSLLGKRLELIVPRLDHFCCFHFDIYNHRHPGSPHQDIRASIEQQCSVQGKGPYTLSAREGITAYLSIPIAHPTLPYPQHSN